MTAVEAVMQVDWGQLMVQTQQLDAAWASAPTDFVPGSVVDVPVVELTSSGAWVQLSPMIRGLVPTHELREPAPTQANHVVRVGETLRCVVLNVWPSARLILLASKRALDVREAGATTAWRSAEQRYPVGTRVTGIVASFTGDGVQVALDRYVSGIVPMSQVTGRPGLPRVQIGDRLECFVVQIDCGSRDLRLCSAISSRQACA